MGIPELPDSHFKPHGNREGMSLGWTTAIWSAHMLLEGDHRMIRVRGRVVHRVRTLPICTGQVDSTTASGYRTVSSDGLFRLGERHGHRPGLPQVTAMLPAPDPLGPPPATGVVAEASADDPSYLPAIKQVSQSLQGRGVLRVGNCKKAPLSARAYVSAQAEDYLCPLANKQLSGQKLDAYRQPVWSGERRSGAVHRITVEGRDELIAHKRGKKVDRDAKSLQQASRSTLKEHQFKELIGPQIEEQLAERPV